MRWLQARKGAKRYIGTYAYDDAGRVIAAVMPSHDGGDTKITTRLSYDGRGNAVARENPDGTRTEWAYTPRGLIATELTKGADGAVATTASVMYDAGGYAAETLVGDLYRTKTSYDGLGRLVRSERADGGVELARYDARGLLVERRDARNGLSTFEYDAYGRPVAATDPMGGVRTSSYDSNGNVSLLRDALGRATLYDYDELSRLVMEKRPNGAQYEYRYDLAGNLVASTDPNGTSSAYAYTPNYLISGIEKVNGTQTGSAAYSYDIVGNLVAATVDGIGSSFESNAYGERIQEAGLTGTVSYTMDPAGRLTALSAATGTASATTSYEYNAAGFLSAVTGWSSDYTYNTLGQVTGARYANGTGFSIGRDSVGRTTSIAWSATSGAELPSYTYVYDAADNVINKNGGTYTYDALNRLTSSVETGPFLTGSKIKAAVAEGDYAGVKTLSLTEDEADVAFDAGSMSIGTYFGKQLEVRGMSIAPRTADHRVTSQHVEVYRADASGNWTKDSAATVSVVASGAVEISFPAGTYAYGVKAHCLWDERRIDYSTDASKATFANSADEILKVTYVERERRASYQYDKAGNRTSMTETGSIGAELDKVYSLYADTDRVKTSGEWAYVYDANGNLIEKGNRYTLNDDGTVSFDEDAGRHLKYSYDLWGRMVAVYKGEAGTRSTALKAAYTYEPEGLRIRKTTDTSTTSYVYALDGNVYMETCVTGETTRVRSFAYDPADRLIGYEETLSDSGGSTTRRYWVATDLLNSVTAETDEYGNLVGRREYRDFGEAGDDLMRTIGNGMPQHESLIRFGGKDYDPDAELQYQNHRWLDVELGKFTTEDPLMDGVNWYAYCGSNPAAYVDPWGLLNDHVLAMQENKQYEYGHNTTNTEKYNLHREYERDEKEHPERIHPEGGHFEATGGGWSNIYSGYSGIGGQKWVSDVTNAAAISRGSSAAVANADGAGTPGAASGSGSGGGRGGKDKEKDGGEGGQVAGSGGSDDDVVTSQLLINDYPWPFKDTYTYTTSDGVFEYTEAGFITGIVTGIPNGDVSGLVMRNYLFYNRSLDEVFAGIPEVGRRSLNPQVARLYMPSKPHGVPKHWKAINDKVAELLKRPDVMSVWVNRGISNVTQLNGRKNNRPDIMFVTNDGKVHLIEVMSPTDVESDLMTRNAYNAATLGAAFGGSDVIRVPY